MKYNARKLTDFINRWLTREGPPPATPLCDFKRLRFEIRPGDVILVQGRSRVAEVIKTITHRWPGQALFSTTELDEQCIRTERGYRNDDPGWCVETQGEVVRQAG